MAGPRSDRRAGESTDEPTDVESAPAFDPTTAAPLPPAPSMIGTLGSEPAAPPTPDNDLSRGNVLGDYVIDSKIGRGGMGDVYLGVHQLIRKRAAIKVLRGDACRDESAAARFIAEARVVNEIGHPNIVDVFAFGKTPDGRHFLAMEYLQGESLRARIARGPIDLEETCAIVQPLVHALQAAHAKGIIHRDLKPDNVFLHAPTAGTRVVKLLDFGIAKLEQQQPGIEQTASGVMIGTPMYIAPEQARGVTVDARADIYTLGGIMFEMITGAPPFRAATAFEVVAKHLMEPPPRASTLASVPRELDDLVFAMLAKSVDERPSLAKILDVMDRMADPGQRPTQEIESDRDSVASIAVTQRRAIALPVDDVPVRSRHRMIPLLAAALLLVAGGAFWVVRHRTRSAADSVERGDASALVTPPSVPEVAVPTAVRPDAPLADAALVIPPLAVPDAAKSSPAKHPSTAKRPPQIKPGNKEVTPPPKPDDDETLLPRGSVKK